MVLHAGARRDRLATHRLRRTGGAGAVFDGRVGMIRSRSIALLDGGVALLHLPNLWRGCGDVRRAGYAGGTGYGYLSGAAVVLVEELLLIAGGLLAHLGLRFHGAGVALVHGSDLSRTRRYIDSAAAAVVTDPIVRMGGVVDVVIDNLAAIDVVGVAYVVDGAVVVEVIPTPVAAKVANADVAEAIVDAAIEADVRTPVSVMKAVVTAVPAPVGRGPERAVVRRRAPGTGNPVVAAGAPGPVAGRPEVVVFRRGGLVVVG